MSSGKKVFVGNLNYETSEDDLKDIFSKAGKVVEATVVRRGYRSKGYGFVEFETEEEAKKSVELLDKSTLNDRSINVQVSTSSGTKVGNTNNYDNRSNDRYYDNRSYDRSYDNRSYDRSYDNRSNDRSYDNRSNDRSYDNRSNDYYDNRSSYGPPRRGYGRPPYRNSYYQGRPRGGPNRRMYHLRNDNGNNRRWNNDRPQRRYNTKPQRTQTNVEKVESKTTIFVANLPFSIDDESLVTLFAKCGQIRTAHIVRNKGRSKGFGFVEFESQEGQQKAVKEMDNFPVPYLNGEQKALSVKVAMVEIEKKETEETEKTEKTETKD